MRQHIQSLCILSLFLISLLPQNSYAQSFHALSVASSSESPSKHTQYVLNTSDIDSYLSSGEESKPFGLSFSDTLQWDMEIEKNDLRSRSYRFLTSHGTSWQAADDPVVTYRGKLAGKPDSDVRITSSNGFFKAQVKESAQTIYHIELIENTESGSVVEVVQADPDEAIGECASGAEHHIHTHDKGKGQRDYVFAAMAPYEAEIAFVVDRVGFQQYDTLEELELELMTIMNYTDAYYAVHQLTYKLTEIYVIEDLQSQPWEESSNAGQMLDNFTSWASGSTPLQHHDVVTLWSGIDFGSTIGIAWVGSIGSPYRQNVVNFPKGRERRNSNVHAHELGHNWGSGHVNSGGWMMSAFLSNANEEALWNQNTINAFPGYVASAMEHLDDVGTGDGGDGEMVEMEVTVEIPS